MELDSSGAAARMVEHGLGVSPLPASAVRALVDQGTLVEVKLADAPRVRRRIIAIHRSDVPPPPPARALLALMVAAKERRGAVTLPEGTRRVSGANRLSMRDSRLLRSPNYRPGRRSHGLHEPAVDDVVGAGDVRRARRGEQRDEGRHLLRAS